MAGSTLARTAHFALHRLVLNPPDAPPAAALPVSSSASTEEAQQKNQAMPARPLFEVCDVWMGAMVPKRWAKRAVTRNAIKRQIYHVGTLAEACLKPAAHVVRLRAGFDKAAYPSATSDVLKAAVRLELVQLFARAAAGSQQMARAA